MKFQLAWLIVSLVITACQLGPRIDKFEQARRPEGITTTIELRSGLDQDGRIEGELLEVQENGLLLNARTIRDGGTVERRLVFVPYTAMRDIDLDELGLKVLPHHDQETEYEAAIRQDGSSVRVRHVEQLRLLSRFPQGLSPPLLEQLLAAEGQTAVEVISGK